LITFFKISFFLNNKRYIAGINKNKMQTGTVKFFNETKGFGFIKPSDSSEDIFVHATGVKGKIRENDKVQFEVEKGKKGLNAIKVEVIS
jgi:CspA family cold shock protein